MRRMLAGMLVVVALLLLASSAPAGIVVVDNFEAGNPAITNPPTVLPVNETGLAPNVIAGVRETTAVNVAALGQVQAYIADVLAGPGYDGGMYFDASATTSGVWKLDYGLGVGGSPTPFDLVDGTNDAIIFTMIASDAAGTVDVAFTDSGNISGSLGQPTPAGGGYFIFPFAHANYAGIDFTNITDINITVTGGPSGSDYVVSLIATRAQSELFVPEPCTMALVGLGLAALARRRRRKA